MGDETGLTRQSNRVTLSLNPWWLVGLLALTILAMLLIWKPWASSTDKDKTVKVTGETTLKAEPDEYTFTPTYTFKNADKAEALKAATAKADEVVAGLKKVGVADRDIKSDADGWRNDYYWNRDEGTYVYTARVQAVAHDRSAAQKVQDYLGGTDPEGSVSPSATFSQAKRKELESKGRAAATKDARAKADEMARNLGFKIGKVKSVEDTAGGYGFARPMLAMGVDDSAPAEKSLTVQPGQDELSYSFDVVYYIR